jgi:hypothetical protein
MRIGYTEGTLLLLWYMKELCSHKDYHSFLNWLLSTSGYYDNNIKGSYFNFEADECLKIINSDVFNSYMKQLYLGLFHCDKLLICSHGICSTLLTQDVKPSDSSSLNIMDIHNLISNKKVLIMSSFAILIEQQVLSGNCRAIYENFPENVIIIPFQTEYTFFNKGNDNNILETFERYKETIKDIDFDLAIVSCGAYTHLLVPYISDVLHKDAITSFACVITDTFGIKTKRFEHKKIYDEKTKKFWLEIPEQYRPKDYLKIENGCYW